jgi:DNA (cytosine-5)-methyltransferase 1
VVTSDLVESGDPAERKDAVVAAMDLFCGAGGFTLGLQRAGIDVVTACDNWAAACETYRHNISDHVVGCDARDLSPVDLASSWPAEESLRVVVGGPPCQGFSSAGSRRSSDGRNSLVGVYAQLAVGMRPDVIVFENVEGFLTAEKGRFVFDLLDPLLEAGYDIALRKVNVANYGVPQLRKRVIAIAGLGREPSDLLETHKAFGAPGAARTGSEALPATKTVIEEIGDMPAPSNEFPGQPSLHYAPQLSELDSRRIAALKPGHTMRDLPEELWHESYKRRAHRRVLDGTPTERRGGAPAGLRRLVGHEPSKAITGAASREFIHPVQDRPLTLRECARLQTFPDSFEFRGNRTEIATMIGNAVPVSFAEVIGRAVLRTARRSPRASTSGSLTRFDVTVAEAMSPALAEVTNAVKKRYGALRLGRSSIKQLRLGSRSRFGSNHVARGYVHADQDDLG